MVDELRRDAGGNILPRYYRIAYGSALDITGLVGSNIVYISDGTDYDDNGDSDLKSRKAVFYNTGRYHDVNDTTPLGLQTTA